jgi:two-component system chemotaxis response regulator CheY
MVVDDDVVSRMVLMHLIDGCGKFDIIEAEDGADAWQQLEAGLLPGIVFCDLRMPRLSGIELLQRVRAHGELEEVPFVLVSSATDKETVQQATLAGATGYIVKPFQSDQVRAHLGAFLDQATNGYEHRAEAPADTLLRLGIGADRLLVYLTGFQNQLSAASTEIDALLMRGEQAEVELRLERLHTGCVTLGLHGAAAALKQLMGRQAGNDAVQAALTDVIRAVLQQSSLVRQG